MDDVLGMILSRYGDKAAVMVMSDHGFANFKRQFNLNAWLKAEGYLGPEEATGILSDVDWGRSKAYGLGINGLYINLRGREAYGKVEPGAEYELYMDELTEKLEAVTDEDGRRVIAKVHRSDKAFKGEALEFAPDLIVGYSRDYRASWDTCLGNMGGHILYDNDSAWSADHCADVSEVPGVLFSNRPIAKADPALVDLAPTILQECGLDVPKQMEGKTVF
jgi:predicted AlkP superfamily phosphohydrolase/phosphomutase